MDPVFSQGFDYGQQPPQGGGMFGGGDPKWKNALLAALAGFMARRSPGFSGNMINGLQDAQTLKQRAEMARQEHQQAVQDQISVHQANRSYDIANPTPNDGNSEFERVAAAGGYAPGSPEYAALMKRKADAMANPMVMTPYGPMPYSAVMGGSQPEILQSLPPGAKPIGGAGPQAPRPFP